MFLLLFLHCTRTPKNTDVNKRWRCVKTFNRNRFLGLVCLAFLGLLIYLLRMSIKWQSFLYFPLICLALWLQVERSLPVSLYQRDAAWPSFFISSSPSPQLETLLHLMSAAVISSPNIPWELKSYWYIHAPVTSRVAFLKQWKRSRRGFPWATGLDLTWIADWGKPHNLILSRDNPDDCLVILFICFSVFWGTLVSCLHNPRGFWHKLHKY